MVIQLVNDGTDTQLWSAIFKGLKWSEVKVTKSCLTLWDPMDCSPWNSPGQNTRVGRLSLLQGIFPTQGSNPGLPHCRQILHQLNHQGSPRILEWAAYPFSSGSCCPRNWTRVSFTAGIFFTNWAIRGALGLHYTLCPIHSNLYFNSLSIPFL